MTRKQQPHETVLNAKEAGAATPALALTLGRGGPVPKGRLWLHEVRRVGRNALIGLRLRHR
ncbi:hypothetical protein [Streptomyces sp. NPDC086776]|uniref:hypothetical protein n=1 Tax=Streptomyces sp. NPDC086776 TaxID=3365756 RepID=UPI00381514AB